MRAAVVHEYGGPEAVRLEEAHPAPTLQPGEVRVKVAAASVNFSDVLVIANHYQMPAPTPFVPGSEFAGVVIEVADDVKHLAIGDRVIGTSFVGAFAEEAVVAAMATIKVPEGVDMPAAAAFGVAHRTAYHALRSFAEVKPGQQVVVLGAGGGVGLAAVQLATALGAEVTAVASTDEKLEVSRANGAVNLVNHRVVPDVRAALKEALPKGAHAVIDPVGGTLSEPALRSLRWGGRFVVIGFAAGEIPKIPLNLVLLKGVQLTGFQFRDFPIHRLQDFLAGEAELLDLLASGRAVPHIGATFAFEDVGAALKHVADGQAIGKVVITF
jgi:NADPH2:quinone reductase